jgi:hypothetical protein
VWDRHRCIGRGHTTRLQVVGVEGVKAIENGATANDIMELKNKIPTLPESVRAPFELIIRVLEILGSVIAYVPPTGESSTKKKQQHQHNIASLTRHVDMLTGHTEPWSQDAILRRAGFGKEGLVAFIERVKTSIKETSESGIAASLRTLGVEHQKCSEHIGKTPDPECDEKGFMACVAKNGTKFDAYSKQLTKLIEEVKVVAQAAKIAIEVADSASLVKQAECTIESVKHLIAIYTLLVLMRNPQVRNPRETDIRNMLKQVRAEFNQEGWPVLIDFLAEADAILGGVQGSVAASAPGRTDAVEVAQEAASAASAADGGCGGKTRRGAVKGAAKAQCSGKKGKGKGQGSDKGDVESMGSPAKGRGRGRGGCARGSRWNGDVESIDGEDAMPPPAKRTRTLPRTFFKHREPIAFALSQQAADEAPEV